MQTQLPSIESSKTALLLMDYQMGILANYPQSESVIGKVSQVLTRARDQRLTVGYVRVAFEDADYQEIPDRNKAFSALATARRLPNGAPESEIVSALKPEPTDIQVRKTRVGAMSTTDLHEQLQGKGIDTIVLAGVATSGVILSTVRDAADKDFRIFVLKDLCLDADPVVHEVLVEKVLPRQAWVITSDEFLGLIG